MQYVLALVLISLLSLLPADAACRQTTSSTGYAGVDRTATSLQTGRQTASTLLLWVQVDGANHEQFKNLGSHSGGGSASADDSQIYTQCNSGSTCGVVQVAHERGGFCLSCTSNPNATETWTATTWYMVAVARDDSVNLGTHYYWRYDYVAESLSTEANAQYGDSFTPGTGDGDVGLRFSNVDGSSSLMIAYYKVRLSESRIEEIAEKGIWRGDSDLGFIATCDGADGIGTVQAIANRTTGIGAVVEELADGVTYTSGLVGLRRPWDSKGY